MGAFVTNALSFVNHARHGQVHDRSVRPKLLRLRLLECHLQFTSFGTGKRFTSDSVCTVQVHLKPARTRNGSVDRAYPHHDPPLTREGHSEAARIHIPRRPDLIVTSPMHRTIETALIVVQILARADDILPEMRVWPGLREAHDAECNKGSPRRVLEANYPNLDFSSCSAEWDYEPHSAQAATDCAERVRRALSKLLDKCENIMVVTHRGLIAHIVQGSRFDLCRLVEPQRSNMLEDANH